LTRSGLRLMPALLSGHRCSRFGPQRGGMHGPQAAGAALLAGPGYAWSSH
jgi:hypothetical protein